MNDSDKAYTLSIKEGEVRVVIRIENIKVEEINTAKEFVSVNEDDLFLYLNFADLEIDSIREDGYKLEKPTSEDSNSTSLLLKKEIIWFDVDMNHMSSLLNNTVQFSVKGKHPNYLTYFIKNLTYKIEWLQYDKKKNAISTVSVTNRSFTQPRTESDINYSFEEITKCAELLSRAIKKIDLRTGSSYVRINPEDSKFNPVLVAMAEKLGYQLEVLDEDTIIDLHNRGRKATHIISLIISY